MPTDLETQNIMIVGAPGTGKSQAIQGLIASALDRGDRMVTVDPERELMRRGFSFPATSYINHTNDGCVGWSLFNEAGHDFDFRIACRTLRSLLKLMLRPRSGRAMLVLCCRTP
ncbi:type IV secretion system DNA-binding domain-containing protein (plasmid) [Burkholderia multivorans]|uniref:type IV secretion system DNA-binding domain-containing protein n=1 Tax=Burkholderia multivorans TaxID=87883 RepID=UPI00207D2012|nr:type IV secretion system DNA-binding domain-containing protein [Burkholderia multivorans]MCO1459934.1 type IV secretion system DNA-binding domain-containing protein [Burkholderia multivorans]